MKIKFSQDSNYWWQKCKDFLHDPPDKAIHIPGHEERANAIIAALGMSGSTLSHDEYKEADCIASGMDRATLPGYVAGDESRNGAVDFWEDPRITHPTGANDPLRLSLAAGNGDKSKFAEEINRQICELIRKDIGTRADSGKGLSEHPDYKGNEEAFGPARFHYLYFLLRRRLAQENIGGLGGLWHRLPADTRIPDHSIWQHAGLASALASCARLSEQNRASLMVYAITPVQDFVGRARKLRDYWSGSIILSWLAFEGITAVMRLYGADHVVYPSLHGQPLVDELLGHMGMTDWLGKSGTSGVASFPNKFVVLVPTGREAETAKAIEGAVNSRWRELGEATRELVEETVNRQDPYIKEQFERQVGGYWEHQWGAVPLVTGKDRREVEKLLHKEAVDAFFDFWKDSQKLYQSDGKSQLYSVSHRLAQAMLAAGKSCRRDQRPEEEGIKCDMFREFEIIHYEHEKGGDHNPRPSEDPFWNDLRRKWDTKSDFGPNERLCALALVKRLAYRVCKKLDDHPLARMFKEAGSFPSTTEIALTDWWQQLRRIVASQDDKKAAEMAGELAVFEYSKSADKARRDLAQWFHDLDEPDSNSAADKEKEDERKAASRLFRSLHPVRDQHKYYAVLMMDGDRMGKLVNGDTLGARWGTALHPVLRDRLQGNFEPKFKKFWQKRLAAQRIISPAVHAAISEALGDFSLHTVPFIVEKYQGRLIYAGGDDVCAVLPVSTVLDAAREISEGYTAGFVGIRASEAAKILADTCNPGEFEKIGVHLGQGEDISISAGIMVAHHKKPLGRVISRAHELLDMAKKQGRNGFALEVDKRSGGGRIFTARWDDKGHGGSLLASFLQLADALQEQEKAAMSSSLAYRLNTFMDGLRAIAAHEPFLMAPLVLKQLQRSAFADESEKERLHQTAEHAAALLTARPEEIPTESLIVANFIGHCRQERRSGQVKA